ncbi:type IV secretion system protein [Campylobacter jejuni]|nr:type IV secretion system protein [Campylobacter jejuni]EHP7178246.1 type IV secretion system protein [Campylobacter jejuni]
MKNEFNTAIDYEASFRYLIEKSNKRAWLIAFISIFIAIISIIAVVLLTPLKTIEPYVIRVDNTTGMVDILTMLDEKEIKANEYRALYEGDNARDQILKNSNEVSVQILSIVLGESNGVKTATVRAIITTKNLTSKGTTQATKVITLSYDYILAKASEENRFLNPLGFKVLTYRIDDEVAQ